MCALGFRGAAALLPLAANAYYNLNTHVYLKSDLLNRQLTLKLAVESFFLIQRGEP